MERAGLAVVLVASGIWGVSLVAASRPGPAAVRYADGAPPGFSGGSGEQSCHACHFSAEPNTAPGSALISGVPAAYAPGRSYPIMLTLTRPGMALGGFQLSARFKEGGAQAGVLAVPPMEADRVKIDVRNDVQYAGQRRSGAMPVARDTARWTINWTAPLTGGAVLFNVAANAADNDESAGGDFVYTATGEAAP